MLKEKIIRFSKDLGIDLIGFLKAERFEEIREVLDERRRRNYLSGFEEKDIEKRIDPSLTFKEVKSIIVIGLSYKITASQRKNKEGYTGKISISSVGVDYHIILKEKMEKLCELIKGEVKDFEYRYFVDTGPLVDRYLAYKSGLGFYGKNNFVINKDYGSCFFIGYILCNYELEEDSPLKDRCLSCNACINNCPTGALMGDNVFNAKVCISYLTQTKDDIDYELREKMTDYIYGCDICQLYCPHNKKLYQSSEGQNSQTSEIDLFKLLDMTNSQFKKIYGDASFAWRGLNILKRNALIVLGNSGNPEMIDHIKSYLNHKSPMIRKYTAWSIMRLDRERGNIILKDHLERENDKEVREEIYRLLNYYK